MSGFRPYKPRRPGTIQEAITAGFDQAGGLDAAAEVIGRDPKWCYAAADPDIDRRRTATLAYDDVRLLSRMPRVTAFAEDLAVLTGGAYLPPPNLAAGELGELAALLGETTGAALAQAYKDLSDGMMSRAEAAAELPHLRQVMRAVNALYCRLAEVAAGERISEPGGDS